MNTHTTLWAMVDDEARSITNGLPMLHPDDQVIAAAYARERTELFRGGAFAFPAITAFLQAELEDVQLLVRHDLEMDCISVDRFILDMGCYMKLINVVDNNNRGRRLEWGEEAKIATILHAADMQRYHRSQDYLAEKRESAAQVRAANKKRGDEKVIQAVDSLSSKRIQQFIDVHRAMHTRERIIAHGADEATITRMAEASKHTAATVPVNKAFNQGMHPLAYKRSRKG